MSSFGGISFTGLASGLDTAAIVRALVTAERRPIDLLESRKSGLAAQRALFDRAASLLGNLRDATDGLRRTERFSSFAATVSRSDFLSATATGTARAGSWNVVVERLAAAQVNRSIGQVDRDVTNFGSGVLTFGVGGKATTIAIEDATLEDIAAAINARTELGVRAEVLADGTGDAPYRLVLKAEATGAAGFSLQASGSLALQTLITGTMEGTVQAGQDAELSIDGVAIRRSSNTVTDAIHGVTLNLTAADSTQRTVITVATDHTATAGRVQAFVEAYNAWRSFAAEQTRFDGERRGALLGDSVMRRVGDGLRSLLGGVVDSGNPEYVMLSQVGIDTDSAGKFRFDGTAFERALTADPDAVAALFAGPDGIAGALHGRLQSYLDRVDGSLAVRQGSLDDRIASLDASIRRGERRLEFTAERLQARFAALESALARLQAQGSALGSLGIFQS